MNTSTQATTPIGTTTTPVRARFGHRRHPLRWVTAAAAATAMALGGAVSAAAPASAAVTYGWIAACFKVNLMGATGPYSGRPVALQSWVDGSWHTLQTNTTDGRGCLSVPVPSPYYWRFQVNYREGRAIYAGTSNWALVQAGLYYNVGPVTVNGLII